MTTTYQNTPYDQIKVGMEASYERVCSADDFYVSAYASGDLNPLHLPEEDPEDDGVSKGVAPSLWVAGLISAALGNYLPGPGTLYKSQSLHFRGRAFEGDRLIARVRVTKKLAENVVELQTTVERADGKLIVEGEAEVIAPHTSKTISAGELPGLTVRNYKHFERLLDQARPLAPLLTAVVVPDDHKSLGGALLAAENTLITPILIGPKGKIMEAADRLGKSLSECKIIDVVSERQAAAKAVAMVHEGTAQAIMKGNLHTDVLLGQIVKHDKGLRTGVRLSHVFVMDVPGLDKLLFISDAAINIAPDLEVKVDIVQNAINLANALGHPQPRVGILSAVETVNPKIPSTLDAAILSKMADRGQIKGGIVDGPLAMDNAIDIEAATTKGITSLVAGRADVLIVPNLESGNMLAKELAFVAHAQVCGVVMGAQCPVILTSRADDDKARVMSCAVALLYAASKTS
ncbi:Phosphate acetyltransferase [Pseudovibrio axinellae]|uniref:Phosphate acetyltransferase n=1 Tax=Pseudovibrio axinellae TaxID=989403 RepID=A0A165XPL2_9HYPH|nr:bifunctional enoyl-CoA hydratase/phosphate acetyltransferase [Pseudovibrio axinellae]KZL17920.1 Phosphate acetyltransferase [Pseudovibrio axinellae]SER57833.1 phosphate butyryltransferase [Pseudovibrio axinellae]